MGLLGEAERSQAQQAGLERNALFRFEHIQQELKIRSGVAAIALLPPKRPAPARAARKLRNKHACMIMLEVVVLVWPCSVSLREKLQTARPAATHTGARLFEAWTPLPASAETEELRRVACGQTCEAWSRPAC